MSKHIYIIAGEASGDLYGSKLLAALHAIDPELKAGGWGGEKMAAEGFALDVRYEEASFMGFAEVILNLRKIMGLFNLTKKVSSATNQMHWCLSTILVLISGWRNGQKKTTLKYIFILLPKLGHGRKTAF